MSLREPPPPKRHKKTFMENVATNWKDFKAFMWNRETAEFMGRTGRSWAQIGLFFLVFYVVLFGIWSGLLYLWLSFLNDPADGPPRYNGYLTHFGPGLRVVPFGREKEHRIKFAKSNPTTYQYYQERVTKFFRSYQTINGIKSDAFMQCTAAQKTACNSINDDDREFEYFEAVRVPENNYSTLAYNMYNLGSCMEGTMNGFQQGEPCFYFTINKVRNWVPAIQTPHSRKDNEHLANINAVLEEDFVPFYCRGMRQRDRERINRIDIFPNRGFRRVDYYPWNGEQDFRPPIVATQVKINPDAFGKKITIECMIFADNIFHDERNPRSWTARAEIELTIDQ